MKDRVPISVVSVLGFAWCVSFPRGAVRLHILHHAVEQEIHGAWITKELARHCYDISPGTLYPTSHRLESEGLLASTQRVVGSRTRCVYRVTAAGKRGSRRTARPWRNWSVKSSVIASCRPAGQRRGGPEEVAGTGVLRVRYASSE